MQNVKMLTFHNAQNYGATLQAYALKQTLNELGFDAKFVNYENKKILSDYKIIKLKSLKSFFSSLWYMPRNLKRKISFKSFAAKYLDINTKVYNCVDEIEKDIQDNDIFVAGSDQIWNPALTGGLSDVYTLNFKNEKIRRIIYGASLGNEELLLKYSKDFKEKLTKLDLISVREQSIINPLEDLIKKNVQQVIDPTLLLSKNKWEELISQNKALDLKSKNYILVYTLFESDEITKIANDLSKQTGLKILHFRKYNTYNEEFMNLYSYGPVDFINAFKNAKYVITNSFHGTVFSIIFEKKFYSVLPRERSGRISDLLSVLNLNDRIIQSSNQLNVDDYIDYNSVNHKIEDLRAKSIEFLKKGVF